MARAVAPSTKEFTNRTEALLTVREGLPLGVYSILVALLLSILMQVKGQQANVQRIAEGYIGLLEFGFVSVYILYPPPAIKRYPRFLALLLAYATFVALNYLIAGIFGVPFGTWFRQSFIALSLPLIALGTFHVTPPSRLKSLYWSTVVVMLCVTVYFVSGYAGAGPNVEKLGESFQATVLTPTVGRYASALLACLVFPFLLRGTHRLLVGIVFAVAVFGVLVTVGRTFWVTTPVALLVSTVVFRENAAVRHRSFLLLLMLLMLAPLTWNLRPVLEMRQLAGQRLTQASQSGTFRLEEGRGLIKTMRDEPVTLITGAGFGGHFQFHSTDRFAVGGVGTVQRDFSHNWYLAILWRMGIGGLVVVLLFLATLFSDLRRVARVLPHRDSDLPFYTMGVLAGWLNFAFAAVTSQPFGGLLWNVAFGILTGIAGVIIGPDILACKERRRMHRSRPLGT